ncbi:MAG: redoxin domain-containing protein [Acholeplasmataceae bacterium]|nr:redoxin domain-containing protein [Acidaminococcaceae bacterium]NLY83598.1 redoxin domain-containing protein [Acholeplasmataceae bacterium]
MEDIIKVGETAPDFTLKDQNGEDVSLSDFVGKKVLLSWHPLAWTSVCTDQMRDLERNIRRFEEKNVIVLGMSVDPAPSKAVWAKALLLSKVRVLADFNPLGRVAKAYGIFSEDFGASKRANILIDEKGNVVWTKKYEIRVLPDVEEVIARL